MLNSCSTSPLGGNLVDDLPPAAHTGAGVIGRSTAHKRYDFAPCFWCVLAIALSDFNQTLSMTNHLHVVRSTLLQVSPSGAPSGGPRGVLQSGNLGPLYHMISLAQVHQMNHSRHEPSCFLTLFPMVCLIFRCDNGKH